uniref:Uncharacterized protein n=1 Tax=Ditylenchus dipsaci TaxID=166011 RepID=A0A915DN57_9BILA
MEIAAPVPKGMEAKQTIRILFGKSGNKVVSSKMKFLGDNWFIVAYKPVHNGGYSCSVWQLGVHNASPHATATRHTLKPHAAVTIVNRPLYWESNVNC